MRWRDERGSSTVILVLSWSVILLCVALGADLGRLYIIREQLRTAEDAASLAGALQLEYAVQMEFRREQLHEDWQCDSEGWLPDEKPAGPPADGEPPPIPPIEELSPSELEAKCAVQEWKPTSPFRVEGTEEERWPTLSTIWQSECGGEFRCDPDATVYQCWLQPKVSEEDVAAKARSIFEANEVWGDQATRTNLDIVVKGLKGEHPKRVFVEVDSRLQMRTYLLPLIGLERLEVSLPKPSKGVPVRRGKFWTTQVTDFERELVEIVSPCDPE